MQYKSKDEEADMDIERLRIEGRQLASQLKKTQEAILKKDQLSGDLFAVDFEQLKIESEALNEKVSTFLNFDTIPACMNKRKYHMHIKISYANTARNLLNKFSQEFIYIVL